MPLLAAGALTKNGVSFLFIYFGPVLLVTFLQAGAWLAADREIRKFEQRVAFRESDQVAVKKTYRFDIRTLLLCTFWLAGAMAILGAAGRLNESLEINIFVVIALFMTVFLSLGCSAVFVGVFKAVRALQRKLFYRKSSAGR